MTDYALWLREAVGNADKRGCVGNLDARAVGHIADELENLRAEIARLRARPTEEEVARTIWDVVAGLSADYDAVLFEQVQERPRYQHLKQVLTHTTARILALLPKVQP